MARHARGFDVEAARAHLSRVDRKLAAWMQRIGPIEADPRWKKSFDVCDALARAILYQQLSGKAAATIVGRVETAIASNKLHADTLGRVDDATIRACGVSGNKLLALRDLAARAQRGEIPDARRMATMSDDEVVQALVPVRGIGRWTVEMMLMFRLGRPDVLPVDDLGIERARNASIVAPKCRRHAHWPNAANAGVLTARTPACTCGASPISPKRRNRRSSARRAEAQPPHPSTNLCRNRFGSSIEPRGFRVSTHRAVQVGEVVQIGADPSMAGAQRDLGNGDRAQVMLFGQRLPALAFKCAG